VIRGLVTKFQTYSTGDDSCVSVVIDKEDTKKAIEYDKEKVVIMTQSEYESLGTNSTNQRLFENQDKITNLSLEMAKILQERHDKEGTV
jgi:non-homologous end joining protein Ku